VDGRYTPETLSGTLSSSISQLSNLAQLVVDHAPGVHGILPDSLSSMQLTGLQLTNTSISGTLPPIVSLLTLAIVDTPLSGSVDTSLLSSIFTLELVNSRIDTMPAITPSMIVFRVSNLLPTLRGATVFDGSVDVASLRVSQYVVRNCSLTGTLPQVFPPGLQNFDVENNHLYVVFFWLFCLHVAENFNRVIFSCSVSSDGTFPNVIANLSLNGILLSNNNLHGTLPSFKSILQDLQVFFKIISRQFLFVCCSCFQLTTHPPGGWKFTDWLYSNIINLHLLL
jgi:Leucine-rich repeat (LRR) protein